MTTTQKLTKLVLPLLGDDHSQFAATIANHFVQTREVSWRMTEDTAVMAVAVFTLENNFLSRSLRDAGWGLDFPGDGFTTRFVRGGFPNVPTRCVGRGGACCAFVFDKKFDTCQECAEGGWS